MQILFSREKRRQNEKIVREISPQTTEGPNQLLIMALYKQNTRIEANHTDFGGSLWPRGRRANLICEILRNVCYKDVLPVNQRDFIS